MSRIAWSAFYPLVLSQVPLCPKPMVTKVIRDAAIEFCERTYVWKDWQEYPVGIDADYQFENDSVGVVFRVDAAKVVDGVDLEIASPERADECYPGWRDGSVTGQPAMLTQTAADYFTLVPAPTSDAILTLAVSLKPAKASNYTEKFLYDDHEEAIASGALARLMGMAGKPWANPAATAYAAVFNDRVVSVNLRASKAFGRAPIRVRGHYL